MKQRKKHISTPRPRDQLRNPLIADGFLGNNCKKGNHGYDVDNEDVQGLFPRYSEWIVFVVILVLRCNYVTQKSNWWVLHPDEIFQAMEGKRLGELELLKTFKTKFNIVNSLEFSKILYMYLFEVLDAFNGLGGRRLEYS